MAILQFSPVKVGQMGVKPASYKMVSSNTLAEITTAGFLKQGTGGQFLERNDVIEVIASYGTVNVENVQLYVTIDTNGVITLNEDLPEGLGQAALKNVTDNTKPLVVSMDGAAVVGNMAVFADTSGTIESGGTPGTAAFKDASDNLQPTVASVDGATTVNNVAVFSDIAGTITDGGTLGTAAFKTASDNLFANVASVAGPTIANNIAIFQDVDGSVGDSIFPITNVQEKSLLKAELNTTAITGGLAGPYTVPAPGLTASSVVTAALRVATNNAAVRSIVPALNSFDITFTADPGANCELYWIALVAPQ